MTVALWVGSHGLGGAAVAEPHGVLDVATHLWLRDALLKLGVEEPRAVIVDMADLVVPDRSALALFLSVGDQLAQWPGVPLLLVASRAAHRELLGRHPLSRHVPSFPSVPTAMAAIDEPPARRVARRDLPNELTSTGIARRFVTETCAAWGEPARLTDALIVVDALVENTLLHTYSAPSVRVELRRGRLTIAVYDDDPATARLLEPRYATPGVHGLSLVQRIVSAWGCAPRCSGGKVVWAVL